MKNGYTQFLTPKEVKTLQKEKEQKGLNKAAIDRNVSPQQLRVVLANKRCSQRVYNDLFSE